MSRAGTRVRPGAVVKIALGCPRCGAASPGLPSRLPKYRVPRFVGRRLTVAEDWAQGKTLDFVVDVGPLHAGNAPSLFDNYRVTRQQFAPGSRVGL